MSGNTALYILTMALVTYLIRMLPLAIIQKQIKSRFIRSFLYYVPYVTLAVMICPAVIHSTGNTLSAAIGFAVAAAAAYITKSYILTPIIACVTVFIVELVQTLV